jgi:hypothetical protein
MRFIILEEGRMVKDRKFSDLMEDEKGVSPLLEYLMLVTIASVFVLLLGLYLNSVFTDSVTRTVLENQLSDVGAEISAQMVDMYLLYPSDGRFSARIYMPERIGDYEIVSTFENISGRPYLVVKSETGEIKKYFGLGNLPLDFSLNGSIHSMEEKKNITYSTENYIYPTAILIAGPTLIKSGMQVEFDPRFSKTNDGYFEYQIDFGDGNVTPRLIYDDINATVFHPYYTSSSPTYYTATLRIWDRLGYSANDSIKIHVVPNTTNPDPEMFIDKFVSPGYANLGESVNIHIFMRGEGFRTSPRYLDVVHVFDVSGSMSPDYMGGYWLNERDHGYTPLRTFSGSVSASVWTGTFEVNVTGPSVTYEILAYTRDNYSTVERWYGYKHKAPYAIQLYVIGPDGSVGNANGIIFSPLTSSATNYPDDYVFGKYYAVTNPIQGNWTVMVIGLFPDKESDDKLDLHVKVVRHNTAPESGTVYNQHGTITVNEQMDIVLGDYVPSRTGTRKDRLDTYFLVEPNTDRMTVSVRDPSGSMVFRCRIYDADGDRVYNGYYRTYHSRSFNNPEQGQWRILTYRSSYYHWSPFNITIDLTKRLEKGRELSLKGPVVKSWDTTLYSNAKKLKLNLEIPCEDLMIEFFKASVSPTFAWIDGVGFNSSHPYDISQSTTEVRLRNTVKGIGNYTIYLVNGYWSNSSYIVDTYVGKIDVARVSGLRFNGILAEDDSVAVVQFRSSYGGHRVTELLNPLTTNKTAANQSILSLYGFGGTGMGDGLRLGYQELKVNASPNKIPAIILMSDGYANVIDTNPFHPCTSTNYVCLDSSDCTPADYARCWAEVAKADNITIYTVALGKEGEVDRDLMRELATADSYYYEAERAEELVHAYEQIATELREKAAENITVTDVIPPNVQLDLNSIQIRMGYDLLSDFSVFTTPNGTALQWTIPQMNISDIFHVSFKVISNTTGVIGLNVVNVSNVTYIPFPFTNTRIYYLPNETVIYSTGQKASMTLG